MTSEAVSSVPCAFDGCEHFAALRAAYCNGHMKQRAQGRAMSSLRGRNQSAWEILSAAAIAYAEADASDQDEWNRVRARLRMAAERFVGRRRRTDSNKSRTLDSASSAPSAHEV